MLAQNRDDRVRDPRNIGPLIDHLVDALGGEPGCLLRRAIILTDIDQNPGTTLSAIAQRLAIGKPALGRDIEWLYNYGCILRHETRLQISGYAARNLRYALAQFNGKHKDFKDFLTRFSALFGDYKPTLRDAKIVAALGSGQATRQEIFSTLYNGPPATQNRAINNLVTLGLIEKSHEQDNIQTG